MTSDFRSEPIPFPITLYRAGDLLRACGSPSAFLRHKNKIQSRGRSWTATEVSTSGPPVAPVEASLFAIPAEANSFGEASLVIQFPIPVISLLGKLLLNNTTLPLDVKVEFHNSGFAVAHVQIQVIVSSGPCT